jgi:DNA-binding transcriptional ArsR family regulator
MNAGSQHAEIDGVAQALSDGTRRSILRLVRDRERSAGDIAEQFRTMSRPAVSQHLRVLNDAGLVTVRTDGNRRMFRARTEGLAAMWHYLDEMWTDHLGRLKVAAERAEWAERQRHRLAQTASDRPGSASEASNRTTPTPPTRSPRD